MAENSIILLALPMLKFCYTNIMSVMMMMMFMTMMIDYDDVISDDG